MISSEINHSHSRYPYSECRATAIVGQYRVQARRVGVPDLAIVLGRGGITTDSITSWSSQGARLCLRVAFLRQSHGRRSTVGSVALAKTLNSTADSQELRGSASWERKCGRLSLRMKAPSTYFPPLDGIRSALFSLLQTTLPSRVPHTPAASL